MTWDNDKLVEKGKDRIDEGNERQYEAFKDFLRNRSNGNGSLPDGWHVVEDDGEVLDRVAEKVAARIKRQAAERLLMDAAKTERDCQEGLESYLVERLDLDPEQAEEFVPATMAYPEDRYDIEDEEAVRRGKGKLAALFFSRALAEFLEERLRHIRNGRLVGPVGKTFKRAGVEAWIRDLAGWVLEDPDRGCGLIRLVHDDTDAALDVLDCADAPPPLRYLARMRLKFEMTIED